MERIPFHLLLPECLLLLGACWTLLLGVCGRCGVQEAQAESASSTASVAVWLCALLTVLLAGLASVWAGQTLTAPQLLFADSVMVDAWSYFLKTALCLLAVPFFLYGQAYVTDRGLRAGEYYALMLFSLLGMSVLVSAYSLLTIFLSIELFSLPLYALVAFKRKHVAGAPSAATPLSPNVEAAIKYFVMGALATGLLLYGFSFFYGLTGQLSLAAMATVLQGAHAPPFILVGFASACVLLGLAFKLGVAPAHMWVPDVYEAAPTAVTYWIASVGKLASLGVLVRFLVVVLPTLQAYWQPVLLYFSLLSIAIGNIVGIRQTDFRRLLGYSSIAHMGYMLLGIWTANSSGYTAALFYTLTYAVISSAAFAGLLLASYSRRPLVRITDFAGYFAQDPKMSLAWLVILFALAGMPPFAGFIAKLHLILVMLSHPALPHAVGVIVVMLLLAVVGAYYYLAAIRNVFFAASPQSETAVDKPLHSSCCAGQLCLLRAVFFLHTFVILWMGLLPARLWSACAWVVQHSWV